MSSALRVAQASTSYAGVSTGQCCRSRAHIALHAPKALRHVMGRNVSKKASKVVLELLTLKGDASRFNIAVRRTRKCGRSLQVEITRELINIGELQLAHVVSMSLSKFWLTRPPVDVLAELVASLFKANRSDLAQSICNLVNPNVSDSMSEPFPVVAVGAEFRRALLTACAARGLHHAAHDIYVAIKSRDVSDALPAEAEGEGGMGKSAGTSEATENLLDIASDVPDCEGESDQFDDGYLLMRALRKAGQYAQALAVHVDLVKEGKGECFAAYRELMLIQSSMGNVGEVEQVVGEMERRGYLQTSQRYDEVVRVYVKLKEVDMLTRIVSKLTTMSLSIQNVSSILCFLQCAGAVDAIIQTSYCGNSELVDDAWMHTPNFEKLEEDLEVALRQNAETFIRGGGELFIRLWLHGLPSNCASWQTDCWSLDLHGAHPLAARVLLVRWLAEVSRMAARSNMPLVCVVITGWGKHSRMAGQSRVKTEISHTLQGWQSPFGADKENTGRLVAQGWILSEWLRSGRKLWLKENIE